MFKIQVTFNFNFFDEIQDKCDAIKLETFAKAAAVKTSPVKRNKIIFSSVFTFFGFSPRRIEKLKC